MLSFKVNIYPKEQMRYKTLGDYYFDNEGILNFDIADVKNNYYEACILIHEIYEFFSCLKEGISIETIDKWDLSHLDSDDPGSIPGCPYYKQHSQATTLERIAAEFMGFVWDKYEGDLNNEST